MSGAIENEITCREVVELVTDHFEDRLPLEDNRRFELHVCGCTGCRVYLAQMRAVVRTAGRLAEESLPAGLREDILRTFHDWKRTWSRRAMLAYKFLADGAVGPFTGRHWPAPATAAPGAWLVAPPGELARYGVHACRLEDLAYWPDEELWLVELGGTILQEPYQLVAGRGRLLQRIAGWNLDGAREYAAACAWRARDLVVDALARAGLDAEAGALRGCLDLGTLQATATTIARDAPRHEPRGLVAYAAGAAMRARQCWFREASLQGAHLGAALAGAEAGAEQERAWQSHWLSQHLSLGEIAARTQVGSLGM